MTFARLVSSCLFVVTLLAFTPSAAAFPPPNVPLYPPDSYASAVVNEIKATHRATYQVMDNYGWSAWRGIVESALDTGSSYQNSLGNILSATVPSFSIREAVPGETPTIIEIAESAAAQQTHCNDPSGWSVACAFLLNPTPAPTYFKAATMQLYPFVSQAAVVEHETNHHVSRACDQYLGGCPNKITGAWQAGFQCTGNPDTLMDCSTSTQLSARFAQPYDVAGFLLATGFTAVEAQDCLPQGPNGDGLFFYACEGAQGKFYNQSLWSYDVADRTWSDQKGNVEFYPCNQDRLHWSPYYGINGSWTIPGVNLGFNPTLGLFVVSPPC